jgi:hypothetical protein
MEAQSKSVEIKPMKKPVKRKPVKKRDSPVKRITVDELLTDDLIRFEICELREGLEYFSYEIGAWDRGTGVLVTEESYYLDVGLLYEWHNLEEGDVFLLGNFEPNEDKDVKGRFRVNPTKRSHIKIDQDDDYRDYLRALYSEALRRGTRNV